jgi:ABC-type oligopeptide transport system substrate-binding subunit
MVMLADQRSLLIATYGSDTAAYSYNNGIFTPTYGNPPNVISKIMGWDVSLEQRIIDAQKLMRDAGYYPKGFTVYMPAYAYPPIMNALSVLGETWKKYLNIAYTIKGMDPATFGQALMGKQFDVTLGELPAYMGEPDELRGYLTSGSPINFISFSNATVDTLWQQQATESDMAKRVAITKQIESAFLADHTAIPYPQMLGRYMWWPYVKGYVPSDAYLGIVLENVWLDK